MIQTSYFKSKAPRERKVCIAKWYRYWSGARAALFAPSNPNAEDWQREYRLDLEGRFPSAGALREYLRQIERETPNPILCCFEANAQECHRRILAAFIAEKLDVDVPEWMPAVVQGSLL